MSRDDQFYLYLENQNVEELWVRLKRFNKNEEIVLLSRIRISGIMNSG